MDRVISDRFSILYNLISSCVNVDGLKSSVHFGLWNWIKDYDRFNEDLELGFKLLICFWFTIFGLLVSTTDFWFLFFLVETAAQARDQGTISLLEDFL